MKKLILSLAAVAAMGAAAAPAAAQSYRDHGRYDQSYGRQYDSRLNTAYVDSLDWKISNAAQERRISWSEAQSLRNQLRQVQPIAWKVETGQARGYEAQRLEQTVARIESAVNRGPAYGRYDRDDRYERDHRNWR